MNYWLLKTEPGIYSWDDLAGKKRICGMVCVITRPVKI